MNKEQFIHIKNGNKFYYSDREMLIRHREDGPAAEYADGSKEWYLNGKLHREDGPASEYANGSKEWYLNGKPHREDGPAAEYADGSKSWYRNDKLHREDGPAIEWPDGSKEWYLNGKRLTEEEFNARMNPVTELTLDEIAEKFGVSVQQLKIKK
jgi:antitoxin component YwqK of YwqJK toxin-antitoxin module